MNFLFNRHAAQVMDLPCGLHARFGKLSCQETPNRSFTQPNFSLKGDSPSGMSTWPPSANPSYNFSSSSAESQSTKTVTLEFGATCTYLPQPPRISAHLVQPAPILPVRPVSALIWCNLHLFTPAATFQLSFGAICTYLPQPPRFSAHLVQPAPIPPSAPFQRSFGAICTYLPQPPRFNAYLVQPAPIYLNRHVSALIWCSLHLFASTAAYQRSFGATCTCRTGYKKSRPKPP